MKAMILAAGSGTRLQPLSLTVPKPLTRMAGTPVMETQIRHLVRAGVCDIVINTSHLADQIENHFGNGDAWGANIAYSYEGSIVAGELIADPVGSGGGIRKIQDFSGFFDEPFIVLCGDAFVNFDIAELKRAHESSEALATILTQRVSPAVVDKYGVVVASSSGLVVSFQEKPQAADAKSLEANTGIYLFSPEIIDHIPAGENYDIGSQLFPALVEKGLPLFAQAQRFDWLDVGSVPDLFAANSHLLTIDTANFSLPGKEVRPGLWLGGNCSVDVDALNHRGTVVIEAGCQIGEGVTLIGPAVIGRGSVIESGAVVRESYLGPYTRVSEDLQIERKIVQDQYLIEDDGSYLIWHESDCGISDARSADGSHYAHPNTIHHEPFRRLVS